MSFPTASSLVVAALVDLREGHTMNADRNLRNQQIYPALVRAQGQFQNAARDKVAEVGQYSYSYADLGACLDLIRQPLADNGLAITQTATLTPEGAVSVRTRLLHVSGESIDFGCLEMAPQKPGSPQAVGSAITYARRYALTSALSIAQTDDDGRAAESAKLPAAAEKSMNAICKAIDSLPDGDYEAFAAAWAGLPSAVKSEIKKRRPTAIVAWQDKFKKEEAQHVIADRQPGDDGEDLEDRTEAANSSGRDF